MAQRVLVTGAAGRIGLAMRPRLARPGRVLRLLDIAEQPAPTPGEAVEIVNASITDAEAMYEACDGVDAVIHLAGHPRERPYPDIHTVNIGGTYEVFEAARRRGVRRIVYASSHHVVGFAGLDGTVTDGMPPRPDTYYGVSKAFGEALGSLYHDRHGMDVVCVRFGSCFEAPRDVRMLATWLSHDDCARLFESCLGAPAPGFTVVWGVSANSRGWAPLDAARALGYRPRDDAERHAAALLARDGELDPCSAEARYVGGSYADRHEAL
jgi:nucleoside-diphosphate-sugar epimerase